MIMEIELINRSKKIVAAVIFVFIIAGALQAQDKNTRSVSEFKVIKTLEVGKAPHGIRFSADGKRAYVALSGDGKIAIIDLAAMKIIEKRDAGKVPLDLIKLKGKDHWAVSQFRKDSMILLGGKQKWKVGKGPSLFNPSKVNGKTYLVSEFADTLTVFDTKSGRILDTFPTGKRPYPADVTRDGVLAFVPNRTDGTVSVIDLLNKKTLAATPVCEKPEGGALTIDDVSYVVACGGSNELAFINTASFKVIARVIMGVGPRPFSVAMTLDGRFGLVNNAAGDTLSILDIRARKIIGQIKVGKQPIVVRMHPDGRRVFVSNEVSGTISIIELPKPPVRKNAGKKNEVIMLGMIHSGHLKSKIYGLEMLRKLIKKIDPDYALIELPPNRFEEAMTVFKKNGVLSEPRARVFPEYKDVLFPLTKELKFKIIPTAGWNSPMNIFRLNTVKRSYKDPKRKADWDKVLEAGRKSDEALNGGASDDPRWIHTDKYDAALEIGLGGYNRIFNDEIGPGGWDNINAAHYRNIAKALDKHTGEGKRFLITYGAGHKGWFLRQLRKRKDIVLINPVKFIDALEKN